MSLRNGPGAHTARPALRVLGATVGARPAAAVAVWAAVLLALLTGVIPGGAQPAPAGTVSIGTSADEGPGRLADDGCATTCILQAAARHEPHGERTYPHGPFATLADDPATVPRRPARPAAPPSPSAFPTDTAAAADRGRAPPTPTGT